MYGKTIREQYAITLEAERRVRAGESRADVAQALGIPPSTVAEWARKGGWRRKDLIAVRDEARGEMILGLIGELTAEEHARQNENVTKLRQALEASKAELETVAPGGQLPLSTGGGVVPAGKLAMAMADNLLRQGQLGEADRAVRLATRFAEAERAANTSEETRWREERERLMKWWAETQTAYHRLHKATEQTMSDIVASMEKELSRSDDACCPKCGRRRDFWPEEVERPDDEDESGFDEFDAEESGSDESDESGEFRGEPANAGASQSEVDIGCHPHWKKDSNGSWYWDGPPGE
jgi:transcriptional regulator with XRE-family HTH domain